MYRNVYRLTIKFECSGQNKEQLYYIVDKLENDGMVMADRGFTIDVKLASRGAILDIPSFTQGKSLLPASDIDNSRKIASLRIHVERVIGRSKKFDILNKNIPMSQADLLDNILVMTCALVNLNVSVVSAWWYMSF